MNESLWCNTCHTEWKELVWKAWQKCPFIDCRGELRRSRPQLSGGRPRKEPPTYPLLKLAER